MRWCTSMVVLFSMLAAAQSGPAAQDAGKQLHAVFDADWQYRLEHSPEFASDLGDYRWNDRWSNESLEEYAARHQHDLDVVAQLKKIDRAALSTADQLNYDLFEKNHEMAIEGYKFRRFLVPLNQRGGIQTQSELADSLRFNKVKDYEDWIARMRAFPVLMDQTIALMREGMKERMVHPKVIMERVPAQIDKQIVSDPAQSPFYKPFQHWPSTISAADQQRLTQEAKQAIGQQVVPAYKKFKEFFVKEYLPPCFDKVGVWQVPHGDDYYAFEVRRYTTTNLTPEQVHEIGLKEVARIRAEMDQVMRQTGFKGTREEFFKFLRTDPRFYYKTPQALFEAYQAMAKSVDPNLVKVFRTLPREPYGVEAIPAVAAPDTTAAYYRPGAADGSRAGTYFVNLYQPETRPKWEMLVLTLHESVPGHHLQIARAHELGSQPMFRRFGGYTAFIEGWGLYAESLGNDMGLYTDPYSRYGQLTYQMWRAVRLVVDTGMHAKHWTRDQAIQYFMENAPRAKLDVVNEIDRYIAWPGQALAYKIGELKIQELRARAHDELGSSFDLKAFHDVVLGSGPLPLDILERNVDQWIAEQKKSRETKTGGN